jgi:tetratricopeptide (TPR) repeat protein
MAAAKSVQELQKLTAAEPRNAAAWHQLGNALLDEGRFDRGISAFRRALRIDDGLAEVHNDLGAAYFEKKWYREAEECFRKAIAAKPDHGVAHANLGAALRAQGRLSDGRRAFQRALLLKLRALLPRVLQWSIAAPVAPADDAVERAEAERLCLEIRKALDAIRGPADARSVLQLAAQAAERFPQDAEVASLRSRAHSANRDYEAAVSDARAAVERKPDITEYRITLADALLKNGDFTGALNEGLQALRLEPGSAVAHANIAALFLQWRYDLAEQASRRAIEIDATCAIGHANLAAALWGENRLEEAERSAREAIRLRPAALPFRTNLALILKDQGRIDEAGVVYRELLQQAPDHGKVCIDFGTLAYETQGDIAAALGYYRKAQASTDDPRAYMGEALVDFVEERYANAWTLYEWRKRLYDQRTVHDMFAAIPDWDGAPLDSGRLLVYGEQGLGDEVMFASMFGQLSQRQPGIVLVCDPRLGALFSRSFPGIEVKAEKKANQRAVIEAIPDIGRKVGIGSLGQYFRRSAADFPQHRGYLRTDPAMVAGWRERLASLGDGPKIGLSWIGGAQKTGRARRSLSLHALRALLDTPRARWISLQYTDAAAEIAAFREATGIAVHEFPGVTNDMDQLAALITALDGVVSVCNTTVHVAGAVGKDVLVMAPFVPEWRYGLRGERMAWYPSARVFRQARYGDWTGVVGDVAERLRAKLARGGAADVVDQ